MGHASVIRLLVSRLWLNIVSLDFAQNIIGNLASRFMSTTDEKWVFRNLGGDFHARGLSVP
ncbi:hypothetical protein GBF45_24535 [Salmonella enterica subsp. enterica]|nr:hypothetical protein [Salmonella enterica subsp. enterica serovar Ealing]